MLMVLVETNLMAERAAAVVRAAAQRAPSVMHDPPLVSWQKPLPLVTCHMAGAGARPGGAGGYGGAVGAGGSAASAWRETQAAVKNSRSTYTI